MKVEATTPDTSIEYPMLVRGKDTKLIYLASKDGDVFVMYELQSGRIHKADRDFLGDCYTTLPIGSSVVLTQEAKQ